MPAAAALKPSPTSVFTFSVTGSNLQSQKRDPRPPPNRCATRQRVTLLKSRQSLDVLIDFSFKDIFLSITADPLHSKQNSTFGGYGRAVLMPIITQRDSWMGA